MKLEEPRQAFYNQLSLVSTSSSQPIAQTKPALKTVHIQNKKKLKNQNDEKDSACMGACKT